MLFTFEFTSFRSTKWAEMLYFKHEDILYVYINSIHNRKWNLQPFEYITEAGKLAEGDQPDPYLNFTMKEVLIIKSVCDILKNPTESDISYEASSI